jgi:transcriptional regulator with XRE-family HTH domain
LRRRAGLSGKQLAESLAWPPSKISKLENGRQTPTDEDIRDWTRSTGNADETEALLATLHTLEERHAEWRRVLRTGLRHQQARRVGFESEVRFFRVFELNVIPGLLQVPEYAKVCLYQGVRVDGVPDDVDEGVRVRMQRQEILYHSDKRFHFVMTEAALRYRYVVPEVMLAQLDRLISLSALPNVKLGVISFDTRYEIMPCNGFWLLDDNKVEVETFSAGLNLAQPQELKLYAKVFESLAGVASYGRTARQIIMRVIDDLSPETEEETTGA